MVTMEGYAGYPAKGNIPQRLRRRQGQFVDGTSENPLSLGCSSPAREEREAHDAVNRETGHRISGWGKAR